MDTNTPHWFEHMSNHYLDRYKRLEKRAQWLRERILNNALDPIKKFSFDKAEVSALEWAMNIIRCYFEEHDERDKEEHEQQT